MSGRFADRAKLPRSKSNRVTSELFFTTAGGFVVKGRWSNSTAPSASEMLVGWGAVEVSRTA